MMKWKHRTELELDYIADSRGFITSISGNRTFRYQDRPIYCPWFDQFCSCSLDAGPQVFAIRPVERDMFPELGKAFGILLWDKAGKTCCSLLTRGDTYKTWTRAPVSEGILGYNFINLKPGDSHWYR